VATAREFSFRTITAAILAFVFLYVFTLRAGELLVRARITDTLEKAVIADPELLLSGRIRYDEFVRKQVRLVQNQRWIRALTRLGLTLAIHVQTNDGKVLYPRFREWFPVDPLGQSVEEGVGITPAPDAGQSRDLIARENYRLIREGLVLQVDASIGNNTWLANGILVAYLFILLQVLWVLARRFVLRSEEEKLELAHQLQRQEAERVARIEGELGRVRGKLSEAVREQRERASRVQELEREKQALEERLGGWSWEDASELEKELERLETQLQGAQAEKSRQEATIRELTGKIDAREARAVPRGRAREAEILERRLRILYKNLDFENRVIADLLSLGDDESLLRAEEAIKRLNDRDENLTIRRKVGGLERANVFELGFGAKGRIYYFLAEGGRPHLILVGAKNTQDKDLAYLRRYREPGTRAS
jgi:hypothetical protein